MASEVDIANLALSHLGDSATVASLNPPEGSAQAEHCARFYPIARDSLLEMHSWGFATKRVVLALLTNTWPEWRFAYACPTGAINLLAVLAADAPNDYSLGSTYTPQEFSSETADDGTSIILTDVENATLRYIARVTDTSKFSPLFVDSLAWLLASHMAGPILKGDAGRAEARACLAVFDRVYAKATVSDANQQRHTVKQSVDWMANR